MSTSILNPVTTPSLLYPALGIGGKLRPSEKHYICPRCAGNVRTRLQVQIIRKREMVFGFMCHDCGNRWYISSRLLLNEVLEEQLSKIYKFTHETKKEFGALLVKTPEGIRMDMLDIGEDLSVTFRKTKEYRKDERVVGSVHAHPISDEFSDWDVGTFLKDDWEKISIVVGANGTINVLVKSPETLMIKDEDLEPWIDDNKMINLVDKAEKYQFLLFKGKVNNLKLLAGSSSLPITSLEQLLRQIE